MGGWLLAEKFSISFNFNVNVNVNVAIKIFCIVCFEAVACELDDVSNNRLRYADFPGIRVPFSYKL